MESFIGGKVSYSQDVFKPLIQSLQADKNNITKIRFVRVSFDPAPPLHAPKANLLIAKTFAEILRNNKTIVTLDLSINDIDDEGVTQLAEALKTNKTLKEIKLDNNALTDKSAKVLSDAIDQNKDTKLKKLSLIDNLITYEGAKDLKKLIHPENDFVVNLNGNSIENGYGEDFTYKVQHEKEVSRLFNRTLDSPLDSKRNLLETAPPAKRQKIEENDDILFTKEILDDFNAKINQEKNIAKKRVVSLTMDAQLETLLQRVYCIQTGEDVSPDYLKSSVVEFVRKYMETNNKDVIDAVYITYPEQDDEYYISAILFVQKGECSDYPNVWTVRYICNDSKNKMNKGNAAILIGLFCFALKKRSIKLEHLGKEYNDIGLLEVLNGQNNKPAYCLYDRFDFIKTKYYKPGWKSGLAFNCPNFNEGNVPMVVDVSETTEEQIIKRIFTSKPDELKSPICRKNQNRVV